jgi:hypothetical protein
VVQKSGMVTRARTGTFLHYTGILPLWSHQLYLLWILPCLFSGVYTIPTRVVVRLDTLLCIALLPL